MLRPPTLAARETVNEVSAMTFYAFLTRRPQDKQAWPLIYMSKELAEAAPFRVSDVVEVDLEVKATQETTGPFAGESASQKRDRDWILAMAAALGTDSGFNVPIVPEAEPFRDLFAAVRAQPVEPAEASGLYVDWSFIRRVLEQGASIQQDYAAGKYPTYEQFSARIDEAARERLATISAPVEPEPAEATGIYTERDVLQFLGWISGDIKELNGVEVGRLLESWQKFMGTRTAILSHCAPHEPQGWQPIETAPHMRKIMVSYLNALGKRRVVLACYYNAKALEMHDDYQDVGEWDEASGTLFSPEGWYEEHESDEPLMPLSEDPTHWMPLPSAPLTKGGAQS